MYRFVVPLLLLLEVLVAFVPAQGLFLCLGALGGPAGDQEIAVACDCGHHVDIAEPAEAPKRQPLLPGDDGGDCDGCLDLEIESAEALRPEMGRGGDGESVAQVPVFMPAWPQFRLAAPDDARAPVHWALRARTSALPLMARVLLERATIQLRR